MRREGAVNFRVPLSLNARLREIARRDRVTLSDVGMRCIEEFLAREEQHEVNSSPVPDGSPDNAVGDHAPEVSAPLAVA